MFGVRQPARGVRAYILSLLIVCLCAALAAARIEKKRRSITIETGGPIGRSGEDANRNTIAVVSGNLNGTHPSIANSSNGTRRASVRRACAKRASAAVPERRARRIAA
jgi:hypothetical protein